MIAKEEIRIFFVNQVGNWKKYFDDPENKFGNNVTELTSTLELFYVFCNDYIYHFEKTNVVYPIDWLQKKIEDTLIDYWLPIERVAAQNGVPIYANELRNANNQALEIMKKAGELGIETRGIQLYLEKQAVARRYPFANVLFIGIPYRDAIEQKWSSLAHEIGHQIYWNSNFKVKDSNILRYPLVGKESIFKGKLKAVIGKSGVATKDKEPLSTLMTDWFEEIFADVIGTRLLGQIYLDSSKNLSRSQSKDKSNLTVNDGDHPSPIIRPLVSAIVLEPGAKLENLQSDFNTIMGSSRNLQKLQIHLIKQNPTDKDESLDLETVEEGIRVAVGLVQELINEKRIQPFGIEKSGSPNFQNFIQQIKTINNYNDTAEEKINEAILSPRVLERFQRSYTVGYCPVCGAQLTYYYCANGHYYV
jgi:hypothetical protein